MTDRELDQGGLDVATEAILAKRATYTRWDTRSSKFARADAILAVRAYLDNGGEQAIREQPPRGDSPPDYCPLPVEAAIRASERARLKEKLGSVEARQQVVDAVKGWAKDDRHWIADAVLAAVVRLLEDEDG